MKAKPKTDSELLDFVQKYKAMISQSDDLKGTFEEWRCYVSPRHFPSPDRRERCKRVGFGKTARKAIQACFKSE